MCENFKKAFANECIDLLTDHNNLVKEHENLLKKYKELKSDVNMVLAVCHNAYDDNLLQFMSCRHPHCNKYGVRWESGGPSDGSLDFYRLSGRILSCDICHDTKCSEHLYIDAEKCVFYCGLCKDKHSEKNTVFKSFKEYLHEDDSDESDEDYSEEIISSDIDNNEDE